ncbi:MAG: exodeoxyribonuclease VII large subunit, partial [bacterium]
CDLARARARLIAAAARIKAQQRAVENGAAQLRAMSPTHTLARGYAIVHNQQREVIADAARTQRGEALTARLARGRLEFVVERVVEE